MGKKEPRKEEKKQRGQQRRIRRRKEQLAKEGRKGVKGAGKVTDCLDYFISLIII